MHPIFQMICDTFFGKQLTPEKLNAAIQEVDPLSVYLAPVGNQARIVDSPKCKHELFSHFCPTCRKNSVEYYGE